MSKYAFFLIHNTTNAEPEISQTNGGRDQCHADLVWKHTWKASKMLAVCDACFDHQQKV